MAVRKKSSEPSDSNRVVVEVQVKQDPGYKFVNGRTDAAWERRIEQDWRSSPGRKKFASNEMRSGFGFDLSQQAEIGTITETPTDVLEALQETRNWHKKSHFVQEIIRTKRALFNSGFRMVPFDEEPKDSEKKEFKDWYDEFCPKIEAFVLETWHDKLLMNNAVAFWRKPLGKKSKVAQPRIITLPPDRCKYTDAMGIEKLKVKLGWHEEDFRISPTTTDKINFLIPKEDIKRYAQGNYIDLLESHGEFFRVYKEERVGWGFAWPWIQSLFHTMAQDESMEIGDRLWGFISRTAERRHKVGHEIRQGPRAGLPIHFITKERSQAVLGFYEGRVGFVENVCNFDQEIEFPFPSADRFTREKYQSVWERMALWSGPVGLFLFSLYTGKGSLPFLMEFIEAEAEDERAKVRHYLADVVTQVFSPPVKIKCAWSNKLFQDKRQALEWRKLLLTCGALSQETALREGGYDPEIERPRKQRESDLAKNPKTKGQVLPIFDPAHGDQPHNSDNTDTGGRPAGQSDGTPRGK